MHSDRKSFRCGVFYIDPNEPAPEEGNAKTMFIGFLDALASLDFTLVSE